MKITATLSMDATFEATKEMKNAIEKIKIASREDDDVEYDHEVNILVGLIEVELQRTFANFSVSDLQVQEVNWERRFENGI